MKRVHIVGKKNHGKTLLIEELLRQFLKMGVLAGTIKHSSHHHELDTPGKDSHRHRLAGAAVVGVVTPELVAVYCRRSGDFYAALEPLFASCQIVLVEGHIEAPAPKVEVWRKAAGGQPLACSRSDLAAIVTDDPVQVTIPQWPRGAIATVAREILKLANAG